MSGQLEEKEPQLREIKEDLFQKLELLISESKVDDTISYKVYQNLLIGLAANKVGSNKLWDELT